MTFEDEPADRDAWYAWRERMYAEMRKRYFTHSEDKGIPIAGTSSKRYHSRKDSGKGGVSGGSRVVPHRYMDEGDKGQGHRREIRSKERPMIKAEIAEGLYDYLTDYGLALEGCDF